MDLSVLKKEMDRLLKIMETLRGPEGCPWDKKQDYFSLQPYILEEAYEVVETLVKKDIESLKLELGDLLLQVVFQAQIGRERGDFNLIDVVRAISDKLIRRHPHVFADVDVKDVEEVMKNWEDIKKREDDTKMVESILDSVNKGQPALMQSFDLQKKAAEVGFDWENVADVIDKLEEELDEIRQAIAQNKQEEIEREIGDLLFSVVNLARFYNLNPEIALMKTITKFKDRFSFIEKKLAEENNHFAEMTLDILDEYWEEAKSLE